MNFYIIQAGPYFKLALQSGTELKRRHFIGGPIKRLRKVEDGKCV